MHTRRGARRLKIAYEADGSSVDPRSTRTIHREFRLRRGYRIRGQFTPIVPALLFRVGELEDDQNKYYKQGGYVKVSQTHHAGHAVRLDDPYSWLFDYSDQAYDCERSIGYQTVWCGKVELPRLQGVSLELDDLYAMAVRLTKANPRGVVKFEAALKRIMDTLAESTMHHDRLLEAIGKLETITTVDTRKIPQQYPIVWCSQDRVDDAVAALAASRKTYGRLGDAMRIHNRLAVSIVRGLHDDLDQMAESGGDFAAGNRAERLYEYVETAESIKARPWTRVLTHVADECNRAAILCERDEGEEARALVRKSVRSLKTVLLRDRTEQVHNKLGLLDNLGVTATSAELEMLATELGNQLKGFEANRDDDFELPVLPHIVPGVRGARLQVLNASQTPRRRVDLALSNLRPAFKAA